MNDSQLLPLQTFQPRFIYFFVRLLIFFCAFIIRTFGILVFIHLICPQYTMFSCHTLLYSPAYLAPLWAFVLQLIITCVYCCPSCSALVFSKSLVALFIYLFILGWGLVVLPRQSLVFTFIKISFVFELHVSVCILSNISTRISQWAKPTLVFFFQQSFFFLLSHTCWKLTTLQEWQDSRLLLQLYIPHVFCVLMMDWAELLGTLRTLEIRLYSCQFFSLR